MTTASLATEGYRQNLDIEYTLLDYERAKVQHSHDYALNIRRANPLLAFEFDAIDKRVKQLKNEVLKQD